MDSLDSKTAVGTEDTGAGKSTAADASGRALDPVNDGSTGPAEEEVLTSLGLSSEGLTPVERDRINKVVQYMHDQRSEDALRMRELEDRAGQFEAAFEDPRVKAALGMALQPQAAAPKSTSDDLITQDELALISTDPARFVKGLSAKIESLVEKRVGEFRTSEIEPIKVQNRIQSELVAMDGLYAGWRKDAPIVRQAAKADPTITTVRQAYERGVLIPRQTAELTRLKAQLAAFQRKTGVEADSALGAANVSGQPTTSGQRKEFATEMDAILDAVERANAMKRVK